MRRLFPLALVLLVGLAAAALVLSRRPGAVASEMTLLAAGDIAVCEGSGDESTAQLLARERGTILTLGDNAYQAGTPTQFRDCYGPSWGRFKDRTLPSPGNHEYGTRGAAGYYQYYGDVAGDPSQGYYSREVGGWHLVSLNSNCEKIAGGCGPGSPQLEWLRRDLEEHGNTCTLAYWHHPRFSSGTHGNSEEMEPIWRALYDAGADVVLSAHDHEYERFAPQDPAGRLDPVRGIRQFVVGTGGAELRQFHEPAANSEVKREGVHGILKLSLRPDGYAWRFLSVAGQSFSDEGEAQCVGAEPGAGGVVTGTVTNESTGAPVVGATVRVGDITRTSDAAGKYAVSNLAAGAVRVSARAPGHSSRTRSIELGEGAQATLDFALPADAAAPVFRDDFERGDLERWSRSGGLSTTRTPTRGGGHAARGDPQSGPAYAKRDLPSAYAQGYARLDFRIVRRDGPAVLLRLRSAADRSIVSVGVDESGKLTLGNDVASEQFVAPLEVGDGWRELELYAVVSGADGRTEVWLDGERVAALSRPQDLGTAPIARLQIGEVDTEEPATEVLYDDVLFSPRPARGEQGTPSP